MTSRFLVFIAFIIGGFPRTAVAQMPDSVSLAPFQGYTYTFLMQNLRTGEITAVRPEVAERPFSPASTWKWVNAVIALETTVAPDTTLTINWNGTQYPVEAWNRNQTMASAFRASCVWYNREIARRIGAQRMQRWIDTLAYGNRDISSGVDNFWLEGAMRITPRQQLELLRRLHKSELPISAKTRSRVIGMFHQFTQNGNAVGFKTGLSLTDDDIFTGWYVGHVSAGNDTYVFVSLIHGNCPPGSADAVQSAIKMRRQFCAAMLYRYLSIQMP